MDGTICGWCQKQAYFTKKARIKIFKAKNEEARVHFIPTLKDGVFVTLCAPLVINGPVCNEQSGLQ
ncbi:hypothetical protein DU69_17935 [Methanosarcina mazei]|uniref:Uncharacterized protein n=1 Tax=Methanosarcina mazei TaxID=2209 RepID=A0A0F8LEZ6_METMZ|nr:hypothetical protein DU69_17935 [Methanosarcina mazei]